MPCRRVWQQGSDDRITYFYVFWSAIKERYRNTWADGVAERGGQHFYKAAMLVLQEFILDFLFAQPQQTANGETVATLRSRIVTTPEHAKRIVRALQENIQRYEASFGVISEATDLPRSIH